MPDYLKIALIAVVAVSLARRVVPQVPVVGPVVAPWVS